MQSVRNRSVLLLSLPFVRSALVGRPAVAGLASRRGAASRVRGAATASAAAGEVYFVMGGPGSGKGTQCTRLVERFGLVHLSAGELLRAEVASGSELGRQIGAVIDEGKIVTSQTTVGLLRAGMAGSAGPFLIDGFPRSLSNLEAFEAAMGPARLMLFLEASEREMEARLLKRGTSSGRSDDNLQTITKRFRTFAEETRPVVARLEEQGGLRRVDAAGGEDEVFARVCEALADQGFAAAAS